MRRKKLFIIITLGCVAPLATWTWETQSTVLGAPGPDAELHQHTNNWLETVIWTAAQQNGLDPRFIKSIIMAESSFRHNAVSDNGALGYMQVLPETAAEMGYDAADCEQNIYAGSRYLRLLLSRYKHRRNGVQLAIAAYNAGPGNVERYRGVPPFRETRTYVKRVMGYYRTYGGKRAPNRPAPRPVERAEVVEAD